MPIDTLNDDIASSIVSADCDQSGREYDQKGSQSSSMNIMDGFYMSSTSSGLISSITNDAMRDTTSKDDSPQHWSSSKNACDEESET